MVQLTMPEIAARLRSLNLPDFDVVIGIGTGGVAPASVVAFLLNADLAVMTLNYRDEKNNPVSEVPVLLEKPDFKLAGKKILVVDDVSVSGKTLEAAKNILEGHNVRTLTMKGIADYVLFPEIRDCVKWPWKP
jgi:hypoxanthine phosphoribosyltransferase